MSRNHCSNGQSCLLDAKSQGGEGCCCDCNTCIGINDDNNNYFDDERCRKPKGNKIKKFRHPGDYR